LSIVGFIPTESGYVHTQPRAVIYYLKLTFAGIPMILCVVSYFFKLQFPIKDEINEKIKKGIEIQKSEFDKMKKENINFYKLYDPVYERKYVGIIPNTDEINPKNSVKTKDFLNHFISYRFLFLIYNGELLTLKKILKAIVILSLALSLFSFILLLYTFEYLSEQKYSFIPITDLFVITALVIIIILFYLKLKALNRVLDGEFELDNRLVKLFIFAKMKNNRELIFQDENKDGMNATKNALSQIKKGMSVGILIGPEGGLDESEIAMAEAVGGLTVSLGKRILRTETAAIAALSMCMLYAEMNIEDDE
jgi:hypothetical protein